MTLSPHQKDIIHKMQAGWRLSKLTLGLYERYELESEKKTKKIAQHTIKVLQKFQLIIILNESKYLTEYALTERVI